jgi:hypothetical protein
MEIPLPTSIGELLLLVVVLLVSPVCSLGMGFALAMFL